MKTKINILILFILIIPFVSIAQSNYYYYYQGEKQYLTLDKKRVYITTNTVFQDQSINDIGVYNFNKNDDNSTNQSLKNAELVFQTEPTESEFSDKINSLQQNTNINSVSLFFERENAPSIGISNIFYIKLKKETDFTLLEQFALNNNCQIVKQVPNMPLWYRLSLSKNSVGNTLDMTNFAWESGVFANVDPAFMFNFKDDCVNDTNFGEMWGLYNSLDTTVDINACEAWEITRGAGINVAVVDMGIDKTHLDLNNNIHPLSYDTMTGNSPSVYNSGWDHGTHVAGTIGASKDNNLQVVGVAPESKLMSVSNIMFMSSVQSEQLASGIEWAWQNGADVINNSWGDRAGGYTQLHSTVLEDALLNALTLGRNGKGTVIVGSSGNNAFHCITGVAMRGVEYPASFHEDIIAVGAIQQNGNWAFMLEPDDSSSLCEYIGWVSGWGDELDVVGPGVGILSTIGDNQIGSYSGTSMATPHVAGIAALILSVNPELTVQEVETIIERTAQKVGNIEYQYNLALYPIGGWNGKMGHGLPDAFAAVQMAECMLDPQLDLYIKDSPDEVGLEPNDITNHMWTSNDIWVRNTNDGGLEHQNPEYKSDGSPNYIYVRVINKSCVASNGDETLTINWAKANTALAWPENWNGDLVNSNGFDLGNELPSVTIPIISPEDRIKEAIIEIPWVVPNPENYQTGDGSANPHHFCLMARINAINDPLTSPMTSNPNVMVRNNNNLAWKNLSIVDLEDEGTTTRVSVTIANPSNSSKTYFLELLKEENEEGKAIFNEAEISLKMDDVLYDAWNRGGKHAQNVDNTNTEKRKKVTNNNVIIDNIQFNPKEMGLLTLDFNFLTKELTDKTEYVYHVIQKDSDTNEVIGGETFLIRKISDDIFIANAGTDKEIFKNESVTISAEEIYNNAIYNWYDEAGNLIYTGKDLTVTPDITKKYKLEIISDENGYKDYDEVEVKVNPYSLDLLFPNPVTNSLTVSYKILDSSSSYIMVINNNTGISNNYIIDTDLFEKTIDTSNYVSGLYTVSLICNGQIVDTKTLMKN